MSITEKDVQILQLAYYFIKDCQYKFVSAKEAQNEIWLGNPEHPEYPVIRISNSRLSNVFFEKDRILKIHAAIRGLFRRNCDLLDIHLSDEPVEENEDQIDLVTITPQSISGISLNSVFPGIDHVVHQIDDPNQEYSRVSRLLEDLQKQKAREVKKVKQSMQPKASLIIMAVCVVIWLISQALTYQFGGPSAEGVSVAVAIQLGAYYKAFIVGAGEFWRLLTCGFVHVDLWHLLVNMMSLYNLGMICEKFMGVRNYLIVLIGSILFGSLFVFIGSGNVVSVGLSGGLYGLMAALIVYGIESRIIFQPAVRTQFIMIILINLMITMMPGVSLLAHLGGFVGGLLLSIILTRNDAWKQLKRNTVVALCVAVVFMGMKIAQPQVRELDMTFPGTDNLVIRQSEQLGLKSYAQQLSRKMAKYYAGSDL